MAPKKQAKSTTSTAKTNIARSDTTSWDASQETTAAKMNSLMEMRKSRVKERRRDRRQEILSQHGAQVKKLREDIEKCVQKHDETIRAIRRPNVERLLEAVRKKHELEAKVDKCQMEFEQALLSASRQLQVALEGRAEDMTE